MQQFSTKYLQTTDIKKIILHGQVDFIPEMQICVSIKKSINVINHLNGLKDKKHTHHNRSKKSFDDIQHAIPIKIPMTFFRALELTF